MKKNMTVVLEFETELAAQESNAHFRAKAFGGVVVAMSNCDLIEENQKLEEKLKYIEAKLEPK